MKIEEVEDGGALRMLDVVKEFMKWEEKQGGRPVCRCTFCKQ